MNTLTVGISSSALFDLAESDRVYREEGVAAYAKYQIEREDDPLAPGEAFPLVRKLLHINAALNAEEQVDVVLLSRNTADTGLRVFNSIEHHRLPIKRAAFTGGAPPYKYMGPFECQLFLSTDGEDVAEALNLGFAAASIVSARQRGAQQPAGAGGEFASASQRPAGTASQHASACQQRAGVGAGSEFASASLQQAGVGSQSGAASQPSADGQGNELRIAFDGDAVLFSDHAERVYQEQGIGEFAASEKAAANQPLPVGPFKPFLEALHSLQEEFRQGGQPCPIRTALVTARSAPAHERVVKTLRAWGVRLNESLFLGGRTKAAFLEAFGADVFFDDQAEHCRLASSLVTTGHVPHGVNNEQRASASSTAAAGQGAAQVASASDAANEASEDSAEKATSASSAAAAGQGGGESHPASEVAGGGESGKAPAWPFARRA